jgi:hypothetical protein
MAITRRELLGRCSMWAALAAMPSALSVMADAEMTATPAALSKDMFASLKGSSFEVTSGSTRQALTLVSVDDISEPVPPDHTSFDVAPPKSAPTRKLTTFSLRFYGGVKRLKQGTYSFQHESTGQFNLFIVPTGGKQFFYTAIFNRL